MKGGCEERTIEERLDTHVEDILATIRYRYERTEQEKRPDTVEDILVIIKYIYDRRL